jgi:tripartite-type tricarboxylate transporter receptor subunit TctC
VRSSVLPDVPTVIESGLPGFDATLRYGLVAPAGTPRPIVDRLNRELNALLKSEDINGRVASEGGDVSPSTPQEYAAVIAREEATWSALIRRLNLKIE